MQTDEVKTRLIDQIKEFLTYTIDIDNDTIVSQYTVVAGLVDQVAANPGAGPVMHELDLGEQFNADYDYFLGVNTINPQPGNRKMHALEGLQERFRKLLRQLQEKG